MTQRVETTPGAFVYPGAIHGPIFFCPASGHQHLPAKAPFKLVRFRDLSNGRWQSPLRRRRSVVAGLERGEVAQVPPTRSCLGANAGGQRCWLAGCSSRQDRSLGSLYPPSVLPQGLTSQYTPPNTHRPRLCIVRRVQNMRFDHLVNGGLPTEHTEVILPSNGIEMLLRQAISGYEYQLARIVAFAL